LVVNLPIPIAAENKVEAERQAVEVYKKEKDTWLGPRLVKPDRAQVALIPRTDAFATVRGKIYPCLYALPFHQSPHLNTQSLQVE
jgi:hypothetical protein